VTAGLLIAFGEGRIGEAVEKDWEWPHPAAAFPSLPLFAAHDTGCVGKNFKATGPGRSRCEAGIGLLLNPQSYKPNLLSLPR
jgi:hypothetical protein